MLLERFTRDNEKAVPSTDIIVRKQGPSFEDLLEKTESRFEHKFYFSPYSREEARKLCSFDLSNAALSHSPYIDALQRMKASTIEATLGFASYISLAAVNMHAIESVRRIHRKVMSVRRVNTKNLTQIFQNIQKMSKNATALNGNMEASAKLKELVHEFDEVLTQLYTANPDSFPESERVSVEYGPRHVAMVPPQVSTRVVDFFTGNKQTALALDNYHQYLSFAGLTIDAEPIYVYARAEPPIFDPVQQWLGGMRPHGVQLPTSVCVISPKYNSALEKIKDSLLEQFDYDTGRFPFGKDSYPKQVSLFYLGGNKK